jgi:hypothetical protein
VVDGLEVHEHAVVEDTIEVEHQDVRDGYGGVRLAALAASDRPGLWLGSSWPYASFRR